MTILRALATAARLDDSVREGLELTRRKIAAGLAVLLATLACTIVAALWLATALFLWLSPQLGQAGAAALTGAVFAIIATIAVLLIGGQLSSNPSTSARAPRDLVGMLEDGVRAEATRAPNPFWDLAAMLAVGIVAGLAPEKRRP